MKKQNKKIIGVFILLAFLACFLVYKNFSKVEAAGDQTTPPTDCSATEDNILQLNKHFAITGNLVVDSKGNRKIVVRSNNGKFKIASNSSQNFEWIDTSVVAEDDKGYYYKVGGKEVDTSDGIELPLKSNTPSGIEIEILLAKSDDSLCPSLKKYKEDGSKGNYYDPNKNAAGEEEGLRVHISSTDTKASAVDNTTYNLAECVKLRGRTFGSDQEKEFYMKRLGACFSDANVVVNYTNEEVKDEVGRLDDLFKLYNISAPSLTSDEDWTLDFEAVKNKAIADGHQFEITSGVWQRVSTTTPSTGIAPSGNFTDYINDDRCNNVDHNIYHITYCEPDTDSNERCKYDRINGISSKGVIRRDDLNPTLSDCSPDASKIQLKCDYEPIKYSDTDPTNPDLSVNDFRNLYLYYYVDEAGNKNYTNDPEKDGVDLTKYKLVYNLDANVKYLYASEKVTVPYTEYKIDHEDVVKNGTSTACERTCEEVVEVKYGPPVASEAGLCFEYQIQVTSKVKCDIDKMMDAPSPDIDFCTPIPYCNSIPGYVHQAGPNKEYDSCVNECDGGKYTKECSESCYNKVYGEDTDLMSKTASNVNASVQKLVNCPTDQECGTALFDGSYDWSGSSIVWNKSGTKETYARYYYEKEKGDTISDHWNPSRRYLPKNGFKTHVDSNGSTACDNQCYFSGCDASQALNESTAKELYKQRMEAYKAAIKVCKAGATCTTKTAEFTIKAKYVDGDGEDDGHWINYPVTGVDTLNTASGDEGTSCGKNPSLAEITKGTNHTLLFYGGCYGEKCPNNNEYHARWSFPGTYRNLKSWDYAYEEMPLDDGWAIIRDKFCLKEDVYGVNVDWWKKYYKHYRLESKDNPKAASSYEKCYGDPEFELKIAGDEYNIIGSTEEFGHFGWNINVECFYATPPNVKKQNVPNKCDDLSTRTRTVELTNLFPSQGEDDDDIDGTRDPGFNWSEYANNDKVSGVIYEDPPSEAGGGGAGEAGGGAGDGAGTLEVSEIIYNPSHPKDYANKVNNLGYSVYDGERHLDYRIYLTRELINKVRNHVHDKDFQYRSFNKNDFVTQNGVKAYYSPLFRKEGGILTGCTNCKIPKEAALGCFNIQNYDSDTCIAVDED